MPYLFIFVEIEGGFFFISPLLLDDVSC